MHHMQGACLLKSARVREDTRVGCTTSGILLLKNGRLPRKTSLCPVVQQATEAAFAATYPSCACCMPASESGHSQLYLAMSLVHADMNHLLHSFGVGTQPQISFCSNVLHSKQQQQLFFSQLLTAVWSLTTAVQADKKA